MENTIAIKHAAHERTHKNGNFLTSGATKESEKIPPNATQHELRHTAAAIFANNTFLN